MNKINIIPQYESKEFFEKDRELLLKRMPQSKYVNLAFPSKENDGFILYDLLDVCTIDEVLTNRNNSSNTDTSPVATIVPIEKPVTETKKKEPPKRSSRK
jgi:hypothetical protein